MHNNIYESIKSKRRCSIDAPLTSGKIILLCRYGFEYYVKPLTFPFYKFLQFCACITIKKIYGQARTGFFFLPSAKCKVEAYIMQITKYIQASLRPWAVMLNSKAWLSCLIFWRIFSSAIVANWAASSSLYFFLRSSLPNLYLIFLLEDMINNMPSFFMN
jgi:hypothetical protein